MIGDASGWAVLGSDVIKLSIDGRSRSATGMAKLLTGHEYERDAPFRVCPDVLLGFFKLDDTRRTTQLEGMAGQCALLRKAEIYSILDEICYDLDLTQSQRNQPAPATRPSRNGYRLLTIPSCAASTCTRTDRPASGRRSGRWAARISMSMSSAASRSLQLGRRQRP